jgi:hypothetical protein
MVIEETISHFCTQLSLIVEHWKNLIIRKVRMQFSLVKKSISCSKWLRYQRVISLEKQVGITNQRTTIELAKR